MRRAVIPKGLIRRSMTESTIDLRMPIDRYHGENVPSNPQSSTNNTSNAVPSEGSDKVNLSTESITVGNPIVSE